MTQISFICFKTLALGPRMFSSYLRSQGYETQILIFPIYHIEEISEKLLKSMISTMKDSSLIGMSIDCVDYSNAVKFTKRLKEKIGTPIIWGGPETVINPEACIKHADIVCIGEGEETLLQLAERMENHESILDVPNIWIKKDGKILKNPPAELVTDLDKYPFPDYEIQNHYIYDKNLDAFKKMSNNDLHNYVFDDPAPTYGSFKKYRIFTARGCPHKCTYCYNNIIRKRYKGRYVRKRSISKVIDELKWAKSRFDINLITFRDDNFLLRTEAEIVEFSRRYKKEIRLPFHIQSTPLAINEKKLKALFDCGLYSIKIGVQTGSERILKEVYKRPTSNKLVLKIANIIHKYRHKLGQDVTYDFILDNPFENIDDYVETLKLVSKMPRPYENMYHTLIFYPGTELYDMAKQLDYIDNKKKKHRAGGRFNYVRFFCAFYPMIPFRIPKPISNFLTRKKTIAFLQHKRFDKIFKYLTIATFIYKYSKQIFFYRILRSKFSIKEIKEVLILAYQYILKPEKKF